jgi:hypothetical protein
VHRPFIIEPSESADETTSLAERVPEWVRLRAACNGQIPAIGLGLVVELGLLRLNLEYAVPPQLFSRKAYELDPDACWERLIADNERGYALN